MKKEEIQVLVNLQQKINTLKVEYEVVCGAKKDINSIVIYFYGTNIYPRNVVGLPEILLNALDDAYYTRIKDLEEQLNELHICTQVKSKGLDYLPINIL